MYFLALEDIFKVLENFLHRLTGLDCGEVVTDLIRVLLARFKQEKVNKEVFANVIMVTFMSVNFNLDPLLLLMIKNMWRKLWAAGSNLPKHRVVIAENCKANRYMSKSTHIRNALHTYH